MMGTFETWRYFVRDGQVLCPRRGTEVDARSCRTCHRLRAIDDDGGRDEAIICDPPQGDTPAQRLQAMLR
jgi:hypothetical protein